MSLPDPVALKALARNLDEKVQDITQRLAKMAGEYGIFGAPFCAGPFGPGRVTFILHKLPEWDVYVLDQRAGYTQLSKDTFQMKLLFLENAEAFEKEYTALIATMYDKLVKLK